MNGKTTHSGIGGGAGVGRPFSAHFQSQRVTPDVSKDLLFDLNPTQKLSMKAGSQVANSSLNSGHAISKKNVFDELQSRATATMGAPLNMTTGSVLPSSKSSHQRTASGEVGSGNGERKVFNFQLDSAFRMDLMKKRMGSKIDLKSDTPKTQASVGSELQPHHSTFIEVRKQSVDVQKLAEQAAAGQGVARAKFGDLKSNFTTTHNYQPRKTAHEILENMPNKQTLMGMIDNQKTATLKNPLHSGPSKLRDWNPGTAISDLTDLKGLKTGITMVRNPATSASDWKNDKQVFQTIGGEIKKEPVSIVRAALIAQQQKNPQEDSAYAQNDESRMLLSKNEETPKASSSVSKEAGVGPSYLFGGLERVFKKKASENDFGRLSGYERKTEEPRMGSRAPRSQSREVHEVKTQNYYMVSLKYNYRKLTGGPLAMAFKEHFYQSFGALKYLCSKQINPYQYSDVEFAKGKLKSKLTAASGRAIASPSNNNRRHPANKVTLPKLTVVLDLDETLISVKQTCDNANYIMPVKIKGGTIVKVRPSHPAWRLLPTLLARTPREELPDL